MVASSLSDTIPAGSAWLCLWLVQAKPAKRTPCSAHPGAQALKAPANPRGKSLLASPLPAPFPAPNLPSGTEVPVTSWGALGGEQS